MSKLLGRAIPAPLGVMNRRIRRYDAEMTRFIVIVIVIVIEPSIIRELAFFDQDQDHE
ncbi:MAG: hypothetical protein F7B06_12510 [Opitutae bacterium]|nr:hypothetical protein [Opitutae bacterium]